MTVMHEANVDALARAVAAGDSYNPEPEGVSPSAAQRIASMVGDMQHMDADHIVVSPPCRSTVRHLACLIHSSVEDRDLPIWVHGLIANPGLTLGMVIEMLHGNGREVPARLLRGVAGWLRAGYTYRAAGDMAGVSHAVARGVYAFLGIADAREVRLAEAAFISAKAGLTVEGFATREGISRGVAGRMMRTARQAVAECEGEL